MKMGNKSIEAIMRRRWILFAGVVVRMEDARLPKCVVLEELVGGEGCVRGQQNVWIGCLLDNLRALSVNTDQWTTTAQDEGERRKKAEQRVERFMAKWIAAEKLGVGLRHAVVCTNVTERTKDRIIQSKSICAD